MGVEYGASDKPAVSWGWSQDWRLAERGSCLGGWYLPRHVCPVQLLWPDVVQRA